MPRLNAVSDSPALDIRDLVVQYGDVTAVDGVSLQAASGSVTALLGPNGAGKTSTIEVACGLRSATGGSVRLFDKAPDDPSVKARIGVMLQQGGLYPTARPLEWLQYLARLYPRHGDPAALLALVGIDPATKTTTRRLSGGEQQRVKLAAALLPEPDFLMLDEPTAGLDPIARRGLLDAIRERRAAGVSILLTTHQLGDVQDLADHVVVIAAGIVIAAGSIAELTGAEDAVSFTGPMHLNTATLGGALGEEYRVEESSPGRYVVHGRPSPQVMASVTAWCAQHGVMAGDLAVGHRTLEQIVIDAGVSHS